MSSSSYPSKSPQMSRSRESGRILRSAVAKIFSIRYCAPGSPALCQRVTVASSCTRTSEVIRYRSGSCLSASSVSACQVDPDFASCTSRHTQTRTRVAARERRWASLPIGLDGESNTTTCSRPHMIESRPHRVLIGKAKHRPVLRDSRHRRAEWQLHFIETLDLTSRLDDDAEGRKM